MSGNNRLYYLILAGCSAGYLLLISEIYSITRLNVCIFRQVSHIPCPSCGTTRSVTSILQGNFQEALFLNPMGYVVAALLVLLPAWTIIDISSGKRSLPKFYMLTEQMLRQPRFAVPAVLLILANWIWNITKNI